MRDQNRIYPFCMKLAEYWTKNVPDLRFKQLVSHLECYAETDPFYLEDDEFLKLMDAAARGNTYRPERPAPAGTAKTYYLKNQYGNVETLKCNTDQEAFAHAQMRNKKLDVNWKAYDERGNLIFGIADFNAGTETITKL